MLALLQQRVDDPDVALASGRMDTPSTTFIWHMKKDSLLEEHLRTFGVTVQ
jgi:hypothetical protein